ncbi:hypothetical protein niasHT_001335 [Heterodera trifolii]|uniref:Uncharacterized protein n=1 Tax=Heterodera trifolii TaxID=157864 RepID=A0ABD2LMW3_9BILA
MFCKANFLLVIFGSIVDGTFGSDNEDEQWDGASSSATHHDDVHYNAYENSDFLPTSHVFAALTLPKANPLRKALSLNSSPISMRKSNENSDKFELRRYKSFSEAMDREREERTKKTMAQIKSTKWHSKYYAADPEKTMKQDELLANFLSSPLPPLPPRKNSSKNARKSTSINDQQNDPSWIYDTKNYYGQSSRNKTHQNRTKLTKHETNFHKQFGQNVFNKTNRMNEAGPSEKKSDQNDKSELNEGTPSENQIDKTKTNRLLKAKEILPFQQKD